MAGTFLLDTHLMVKAYLGSYGRPSVIFSVVIKDRDSFASPNTLLNPHVLDVKFSIEGTSS